MNRTKLEQWIERVEGIPYLTRENLQDLQLRRLNETLARLPKSQGLPREVSSLDALSCLPFTTPQMLSDNPGRYLATSQAQVSRVISGATSGTTGPAKRVFYTAADCQHTVGFFAAGISEMLSPGEKCLIAFPFSGAFGLGNLIARAVESLGAVPVRGRVGACWEEAARQIKETGATAYIGFPVPLLGLLRLYPGLPIRRALVSGDACPAGVMKALEALLEGPLYPHYGSRECGLGGAVTCPALEGMHLRENHIIAEIVDPQGRVLPQGTYGELVITTVGLEAMPLIRYRTGDYTRFLPPCPCGGVTRRIGPVSRFEGAISMEALDSALFSVPTLVDYTARHENGLHIGAKTLHPGQENLLYSAAHSLYPNLSIYIETSAASCDDRPLYPGKRYILK